MQIHNYIVTIFQFRKLSNSKKLNKNEVWLNKYTALCSTKLNTCFNKDNPDLNQIYTLKYNKKQKAENTK